VESFSKRKKVEFWTRVVLLVVSEYQHYFFLDFDNRHTLTLSGRRSHKLPSLRYGAGRGGFSQNGPALTPARG